MEFGIVKGSEVVKNLDGEKKSRVLQVEISDPEDVQSVELFRIPGDDQNPADDTRVILLAIGPAAKVAIAAADVEAVDDLEKGEREIYSTDGSDRLATIRLNVDSEIVLNAGEDWAVQFSEMKAAFDDLKSEVNDFVSTFNGHIHTTTATPGTSPTPGTISVPTSQATPPAADMSGAKVEKVRLP